MALISSTSSTLAIVDEERKNFTCGSVRCHSYSYRNLKQRLWSSSVVEEVCFYDEKAFRPPGSGQIQLVASLLLSVVLPVVLPP